MGSRLNASLRYVQVVYVMPSTSGRAATYPRRVDKLKFFNEVKELRDDLKRKRQTEGVVASGAVTSPEMPGSRGLPGSPSEDGLEPTAADRQQACTVGVSQSKSIESSRESDASTCTGTHNSVIPNVAL